MVGSKAQRLVLYTLYASGGKTPPFGEHVQSVNVWCKTSVIAISDISSLVDRCVLSYRPLCNIFSTYWPSFSIRKNFLLIELTNAGLKSGGGQWASWQGCYQHESDCKYWPVSCTVHSYKTFLALELDLVLWHCVILFAYLRLSSSLFL